MRELCMYTQQVSSICQSLLQCRAAGAPSDGDEPLLARPEAAGHHRLLVTLARHGRRRGGPGRDEGGGAGGRSAGPAVGCAGAVGAGGRAACRRPCRAGAAAAAGHPAWRLRCGIGRVRV